MKAHRAIVSLAGAAFIIAGDSARAQFSGYFGGYYAPARWQEAVSGNSCYQDTGYVYLNNAPGSVDIVGAVCTEPGLTGPQLPQSIIDYSILLSGTGLQPIAFGYLFNGAADGYDSAQLIYYNGSGAKVTVSLSSCIGVEQTYSGFALGGRTIDFRLYSNNDTTADCMVICAVPEPSSLTLLGLGAGALQWRLRRRLS